MGSARLAPVGVVVFVPAGLVVAAHVYVLWRRKRGNERSSITENNPAFRVDNGGCGCVAVAVACAFLAYIRLVPWFI